MASLVDVCVNNHGGNSFSVSANPSPISKEVWRRRVSDFIRFKGWAGATADEVAEHFGVSHNTVAPRLTELKVLGVIYALIENHKHVCRKTRAGKSAGVWVVDAYGAVKV